MFVSSIIPILHITKLLIDLSDDTILDLWGGGPNRPPIDTHHPAVRTHPVTKLKALNVNPGFVTGFAELKKAESGKLDMRTKVLRLYKTELFSR